MQLTAQDILRQMLASMATQLVGQSAHTIQIAESEISGIAQRVVTIGAGYLAKQLTDEQAKALLTMQLTSAKEALTVAAGFGEILAEKIPSDALASVKDVVNGILHFNLI